MVYQGLRLLQFKPYLISRKDANLVQGRLEDSRRDLSQDWGQFDGNLKM